MGEKKKKPLDDAAKAAVRADFREWSGGYHPGEAGEEHERYLEEHEGTYGHDELDLFLTEWGEEELEKERRSDEAKGREQLLKHAHTPATHWRNAAKRFLQTQQDRRVNVLVVDDCTLYLQQCGNITLAKAQWSDLLHSVEKLLQAGAEELWHEFVTMQPGRGALARGVPNCGICGGEGTFTLKNCESRFCICPNGRKLKEHARREGTVPT